MAHLLRSNTQISRHPRECRTLSQSRLMWNSSEDLFSSIRGKHEHKNAVFLACGLCQNGMPDAMCKVMYPLCTSGSNAVRLRLKNCSAAGSSSQSTNVKEPLSRNGSITRTLCSHASNWNYILKQVV